MTDNLSELLPYLVSGAGIAAWLLFVSNVVRNWRDPDSTDYSPVAEWIRSLTSFQMSVLIHVANVSVPLLAYVINLAVPADVIASLQPHFAFVATLLMLILAQQGYYVGTKPKPEEETDL